MRKILYGVIGLVVILVGAALVVPGMIDWNSWKGEIAARAKAATGRDLVIAGDLDLAMLPAPRLSVHNVRLRNVAGASDPDMAVLRALDVRIRFAPLLSGKVEVESITLVEPVIRLEKLADGGVNWEFKPEGAQSSASPAQPAAPSGGVKAADDSFRLDALRIVNGTLVWRDAAAKSEERIEKLNATVAAETLSGPFKLAGNLVAHGVPLTLDVAVGRLNDGARLPLTVRAGVTGAEAKLALSGAVEGLDAEPKFSGRLEADGPSLTKLVAAAAPGAGALPGFLGQNFHLQAQLSGGAAGGAARDIELTLGGARATGGVTFDGGDRPKVTATLIAGTVDLDKWLKMAPAAAAKPAVSGGAPSAPAKDTAQAQPAPFALPAGINVAADVTVDSITWQGQAARNIRLQASLNEGELTLRQASLRLPGEAELSLLGFLTAKSGKPAFDGSIDARADILRATLDWLNLPVAQVPTDRLRKFALNAKLRGDGDALQVIGAKISLDTSRIDGGVTFALRARPAFGASIAINQLNLDAYLPPAPKTGTPASNAPVATGAPTPLTSGAKPAQPAPRGPLAALNDFDANLRLEIGSLTLRQTPVQGVAFDGTLAQGKLTVRNAAVHSLAGTSASLKGELSGFDGLPVFRGNFAADSRNLTGLLRIAGLEQSLSARRLGVMRLRGKADGGAEQVKFDTTLDIAGGRLSFDGAMEALSTKPALNGTLKANYRELSDLTAALGGGDAGRKLGAMTADISLKGGMDAVTSQGRVRAVGGELTFGARALGMTTAKPQYDLNVNAQNPELRDLLRAVAPDYRPAAQRMGPFKLQAALTGGAEELKLGTFNVSAGPAVLSGEGTLAMTGKRPKLTASLTAGALDLNPFLPAPEQKGAAAPASGGVVAPVSTPGGAASANGERYSTKPLDLGGMNALDAVITLAAKALIWRNFQVDDPKVEATLDDRLLTVSQIAGKMFDGSFLLKGKLDGRKTPALEANIDIAKANIGKALFQAAEFDVASGKLDFQAGFTSTGNSPYALVSALGGQGKLNVRDGVVKGFDLRAVSDRLKELNSGLDFVRLLGSSMGGGQTPFSALDGTFKVTKGVLRTEDLKLVADAGEGTAAGFADLPRWNMDFNSQFRLTEHPKAPPFGMQARGPIDNPSRIFKFEALQTYLLQRGVGTLLRKALGGKSQDSGTQQQQPQQQQQQQPKSTDEDLLRGIFDVIRKR